ncbi:MAG: hypothetical protein AAF573_15110, partial [Bacteroidota bacterium]
MALDDFEKEIFQNLDGYHSDLNVDEEWNNLEQSLNTANDKRKVVFWWLSGLGMVLIITIFYSWMQDNNTSTNVREQALFVPSSTIGSQFSNALKEQKSPKAEAKDYTLTPPNHFNQINTSDEIPSVVNT